MSDRSTTYDLLKTELELVQKQIDKYDQLSASVKAWTVTLWAASVGWSFQVKNHSMILIGVLAALAFWVLDAVNKGFRQDYRDRRTVVAKALQDIAAGKTPDIVTPSFPAHEGSSAFRQMFRIHLFILYVTLIVVGVSMWAIG